MHAYTTFSEYVCSTPPPSLKKFKVLPFLNIFPKEKVSRKKPTLNTEINTFSLTERWEQKWTIRKELINIEIPIDRREAVENAQNTYKRAKI